MSLLDGALDGMPDIDEAFDEADNRELKAIILMSELMKAYPGLIRWDTVE